MESSATPAPASAPRFIAARRSAAALQRGIALGLFAEDPAFSYTPLLKEIVRTGADHVALIVPYYQHDLHATELGLHPRFSPTEEVLERTVREARAVGLRVVLFPIVRLEYAVTADEWRGALEPRDEEAWWRSYRTLILKLTRLAARHEAAALCVGSELSTLDGDPARWRPLVAEVRRLFRGQLVYSANWDRYERVGIWELVDQAGVSAYFPLTEGLRQPPLERLIHAWRELRVSLSRFHARVQKPLVFTELGYHSQDKTNATPWDEAADQPVNLAEQADCYRAFVRVWSGAAYLGGVYFWNWFGWGGPTSRDYTPRGKPATRVICEWFGVSAARCPSGHGAPWFDTAR